MFKIDTISKQDIDKFGDHLFCIITYLSSYEHMGTAKLWITNNNNNFHCNNFNCLTIDALTPNIKESVNNIKQIFPSLNVTETHYKNDGMIHGLFLYVNITSSVPPRQENKFKINKLMCGV